jgi:hypothetical protein
MFFREYFPLSLHLNEPVYSPYGRDSQHIPNEQRVSIHTQNINLYDDKVSLHMKNRDLTFLVTRFPITLEIECFVSSIH